MDQFAALGAVELMHIENAPLAVNNPLQDPTEILQVLLIIFLTFHPIQGVCEEPPFRGPFDSGDEVVDASMDTVERLFGTLA